MLTVRVKCPHCKHMQNTHTIFRVRCHNCQRTYEIYPLDSHGRVRKSRVYEIIEGTEEQLHKMAYKKIRQNI